MFFRMGTNKSVTLCLNRSFLFDRRGPALIFVGTIESLFAPSNEVGTAVLGVASTSQRDIATRTGLSSVLRDFALCLALT